MFELIITLAVIAIGIVLCNIMVDMKATRAYLEALCEGDSEPLQNSFEPTTPVYPEIDKK